MADQLKQRPRMTSGGVVKDRAVVGILLFALARHIGDGATRIA
jgi:hypothetical protein